MSKQIDQQNICIIGPGAVGLFLAILAAKKHIVNLLVKEDHKNKLTDKSLSLIGAKNQNLSAKEFKLISHDELYLLPQDTSYWLCVKAYDLDAVLVKLLPYLGKESSVLLFSNGLNLFLQAAEILRKTCPIIRVLLETGLQKISETEVKLAGTFNLSIASMESDLSERESYSGLFKNLGAKVTPKVDIATAEWHKAVTNLVLNTICTIADKPNAAIYEIAELKELASGLLNEIKSVAAKEGFDLSEQCGPAFFENIKPYASNINASLMDLRNNRKTENDYLLGRFLRIADSYAVDTPYARTLYLLLKAKEQSLAY